MESLVVLLTLLLLLFSILLLVAFIIFIVQIIRKKPKKKLGITSLCLLGICIVLFTTTILCNNYRLKQLNCEHDFVVIDSKETSCDENEKGWIKYKCSKCNLKKVEETEPTHTFGEWETTKEPTCTEEGIQKRVCSGCGLEESKTLSKTDHKYVDGEMVLANVQSGKMYKKTKCSVCGAESTKAIDSSKDELIKYYKDNSNSYSYEQIARAPDEYKGKLAVFTGKVVQVSGNILRVSVTRYGTYSTYYKDTVYVKYYYDEGLKVLENDIITMYGVKKKKKTYKTVLGAYVTIPSCDIYYAELSQ